MKYPMTLNQFAVLLYVISLFSPAIIGTWRTLNGFDLLVGGMFGIFAGIVAGYGKILLWISWSAAAKKRNITSLVLALFGFAIGCQTFFLGTIIVDEGGTQMPIVSFGIAVYLWLASFLLTALQAFIKLRSKAVA